MSFSEKEDFKLLKSEEDEGEVQGAFNQAMEEAEKQLKVYPQRYIMAILYSFMALAISLQQSMYSAEAEQITIIYDTSKLVVSSNQLIHMLLHFPLSFPANYIVDKYGIKMGVLIAGVLLFLAGWVRCLVNVVGFGISIVGAVLVGTANPFIINSLNKVSANWFYPSQRQGVTSFLSFFSTVTGLAGMFIPGIWFGGFTCEIKDGEQNCDIDEGRRIMMSLSLVLAIIGSILVIPCMLFFKEKPPTPPSFVDDEEREDFSIAMKVLAKDKNYILQSLIFAIYYGSFQDLASFLSYILSPYNITNPLYVALLSAIPIVSGIGGSVLTSIVISKTQMYKRVNVFCMLGGIAGIVSFAILLQFENWVLLIPSALFLGFAIIPLIPSMTEWCCETSYPIGEPTVTGFLWAIAHIYAGTTGLAYTSILENGSRGDVILIIAIITALFLVGLLLIFFVKAPLKRLQAEKEKGQQQKQLGTFSNSDNNNKDFEEESNFSGQ